MSFVRDNLTALTSKRQDQLVTSLGDAMDAASEENGDGADPLLNQLHQIALVIVSLRNQANIILSSVSNADATVDFDQLTALLNQIGDWKVKFQQVAAQRAAQNPYAVSWTDQAILDIGNWAQGVLNALPNAVAAIPNAFVNAAGRVIGNAGSSLFGASLPWLAIVGVGLFVVTQAEKTRTYRKVVA